MKEGAKQVEMGFTNPDDDWVPVMLVRMGKKCATMMVSIGDDKDTVGEAITGYLRSNNADEAVFIASSWMVCVEGEKSHSEIDQLPSASQHPNRKEALVLTHVTRNSARMFVADIHRHNDAPPTLGKWSKPTSGLAVRGRFVDAMRLGIG
jgi:hypothetical protein